MGNDKDGFAGASRCKGFFRAHEQLISGWLLDQADPERKLDVEILVDGQSVGFAPADRYDSSVQSQYGGDGKHAFAFYYDAPNNGWVEGQALVREASEGAELRSKLPQLTRSEATTPGLVIENVTPARIVGQAPGYPPVDTATVEFWSDGRRIVSEIPLRWLDKRQRRFEAELTPEAVACLLSGPVEVALPGLGEAQLAVPIALSDTANVTRTGDTLTVELSGSYEDGDSFQISLEFLDSEGPSSRLDVIAVAGKVCVNWPADIPDGASIQVLVCGQRVPTTVTREIELSDVNFARLHRFDDRDWEFAEGCTGERGFYAFPPEIASEYGLSGHFVHLWTSTPGNEVCISQRIHSSVTTQDILLKRAVLRARRGLRLAIRLVDDLGIVGEAACSSRGEQSWVPLHLEVQPARAVEGGVRLEIVAQGDAVDELEIALANCAPDAAPSHEVEERNLLINDKLEHWPHGAGVLRHTVRGEVCLGWRVFNRKCQNAILSRAVMEPDTGSIGLAIAATHVPHYFRLEADLSGPVAHASMIRFRAGMSGAARRLLSQSTEATPDFTSIDRIFVLRRTRARTDAGFVDQDEIVSTVARKVPIGWNVEEHSFQIQPCDLPAVENDFGTPTVDLPEITYHIVFEFRRPLVLALHDIDIASVIQPSNDAAEQSLQLEDRNIELQVPLLKTIAHWCAPVPKLPVARTTAARSPLKWSVENSREPVEIVIPVYNALEETIGCLDSLARSTAVPILVRLIDDGSDADVREALEAYAIDKPWLQIHSLGTNRGYTFAADFGIRNAQSSWVVLLNSDTVVTRGWLEGLLACARSDPKIAFVGPLSNAATYQSVPQIYDAAGRFKTNGLPVGLEPDDIADMVRQVSSKDYPEVPLLNGFCTLMARSVYLEVGGLNCGAFPTGYGEENDLCIRVRKAGARLAVADDVYVYHHKSASFGHARRAELSKKGGAALRKLHPEVDINSLTAWFKEIPPLAAVRAGLTRKLADLLDDPGNHDASAELEQNIAA